MSRKWKYLLWCGLLLASLSYGALVVTLGNAGQLQSSSPYHRLQAEALMDGHVWLADSIQRIDHGLVWHNGHVQHVWGLGVGLLLMPFEAARRLLGLEALPDRIALGIAYALLGAYVLCTSWRFARIGRNIGPALAFACLILLCPAVWTLARGPQKIFEETEQYALLTSLAILVAVVRVACFGERRDFLVCCVISALAGFVRPTHALYGLLGVTISMIILWKHGRARWVLTSGALSFVGGLGLLAWTNAVRFGSPLDFGHKLTVTSWDMAYLTRFENPIEKVGFVATATELFGLLFLTREPKGGDVFAAGLFPGQSEAVRWRNLYLTTFDLSVALLCSAAIIAACGWLWQRRGSLWRCPSGALTLGLLLWAGVGGLGLGLFYLRYPVIASRYLMDFAPALTGALLPFWMGAANRFPKLAVIALVGWLSFELVSSKVAVPTDAESQMESKRTDLPLAEGRALSEFGGRYSVSQHPHFTGIAHNGHGWDDATGKAKPVVMVAMDHPGFVELTISPRLGHAAREDVYRAMIDSQPLRLRDVVREGGHVRVTFDVPEEIRNRHGVEFAFLCFVSNFDAEARQSERLLRSIHWR